MHHLGIGNRRDGGCGALLRGLHAAALTTRAPAQLDKAFDTMDLVDASLAAGGSPLEFTHRLVEATAAVKRMREVDPEFAASETGKQMIMSLERFTDGSAFTTLGYTDTPDSRLTLMISEVPITPPNETELSLYRSGNKTEAEARLLLEPRISSYAAAHALFARASGLLSNAEILAGRKQGAIYVEPPPRTREAWLAFCAPIHPDRVGTHGVTKDSKRTH
jgi:hypothetical protein